MSHHGRWMMTGGGGNTIQLADDGREHEAEVYFSMPAFLAEENYSMLR